MVSKSLISGINTLIKLNTVLGILLLSSCFVQKTEESSTSSGTSASTSSTSGSEETSSSGTPRWNSFPHPAKDVWLSPNPTQPDLFHGFVAQEHGIQFCQKCHGEDLAGGSSEISCSQCHPGYPTNHLILSSGEKNPEWGGRDSGYNTHHSQLFRGLPPTKISSDVRNNCTLQCHTPLETPSSAPTGDCVSCHHNTQDNFSALTSIQAEQWAKKSKDSSALTSLHHSKIFSGMSLPEKEQRVSQDCYQCHARVSQSAGRLTGDCVSCHHQSRAPDKWLALLPEQQTQWNKATSDPQALEPFHHKNVFQGLSLSDRHALLETTCASQCHTPLIANTTAPTGDCVSCHHTPKGAFSPLSAIQGDQWAQGSKNPHELQSLHHSKIFVGMSLAQKEQRVSQDCSRCHTLVNQATDRLGGDCLRCHHQATHPESWVALSTDQQKQWNAPQKKSAASSPLHHKNIFSAMSLDEKNVRVSTDCTACHTISKIAGVSTGDCYQCHHRQKTPSTWVAFSAQQSEDWKGIAFSGESLAQSHHKNAFSGLAPAQRTDKVVQDCTKCHTVMSSSDSRLTGDCFACHHTSGGTTRWPALSETQAADWKKIPGNQPVPDIHHRLNFLGLTGSAFTQKVQQCSSCHVSTSTQTSKCMTCHHGLASSDPAQFQTFNAYGDQPHLFAKRADNKDGEYHSTHHKNLFPADFNSAEFQSVKSTCLQCHPVTVSATGNDLGFCIACHHGFPENGYYNDKIARLALPNKGQEGWETAHYEEVAETGLINSIQGYRKTCLLCHRAKGTDNKWLPRPSRVIQDNPAKTNCNSCHDFRSDENFNLFLDE